MEGGDRRQQRRAIERPINRRDAVRKRRIGPAHVVERAANAEAEDQRHTAVTGLVLRVVPGEVAEGERARRVGVRLDVLRIFSTKCEKR